VKHIHRISALALLCAASVTGCSDEPEGLPTGTPGLAAAPEPDGGEPSFHGAGIPFADTRVFFEFNSTDHDLGFQLMLDGEAWQRVQVFDPERARLLDFQTRGRLRELGLTELRFESDEPSPGEVLDLFAPGTYRFVGVSVDGQHLVGSGELSHDLPSAPVFVHPEDGEIVDADNLVIEWEPIGGLAGYEVIVENEDTGSSMSVELDGAASTLGVPGQFLEEETGYKAEILAVAGNGNKTISEVMFSTK